MESPFACFFRKNQEKLTENDFSAAIHARALHERQAVGYTTRKGVRLVPITLTAACRKGIFDALPKFLKLRKSFKNY